ncbi:hypothetical protein EX30DRAFT_221670 [Ascodesmis nigricans]|uniref:Uncharacterized protein n=1 Tax=Ascodesmis nigricans TaxID=341454 RepID=A0A4S2N055_9PEZI|nr:hypothetical protein EX30DRAFT_221670 [Ascodesmis nigricans]
MFSSSSFSSPSCSRALIFITAFLYLATAPLDVAAQEKGERNASKYGLMGGQYSKVIEKLDKELSSKRRGVGDVLDSAPYLTGRPTEEMYDTSWFVKGFTWNPNQDEDVKGENWHPEGITTSFDAGYPNNIIPASKENSGGNTGVIIVSWNDQRNFTGRARDPSEGVRVSFVRKGTAELGVSGQAYSHALLVEPYTNSKGDPDFRPLKDVESGGIVWRKNWLYITDKALGIRVFDLEHIYQVGTGDTIGRGSKGGYSGGSYAYVIPQALMYTLSLAKDLEVHPNSISFDRNASSPSLLISEAVSAKTDIQTLARFPLDEKTDLLKANELGAVPATWVYGANVRNCEGIVYAERSYFLVTNEGTDVKSSILNWKAGSNAEEYDYVLPNDAQSVAYVPEQQELWFVGGMRGRRYVMALSSTLKNQTVIRPTDDPAKTQPAIPEESLDGVLEGNTGDKKEEEGGSKKLSGGAIAGIVIGALVGVTFLAGIGFFFFRQKQQQREAQQNAALNDSQMDPAFYKPELDPQSTGGSGGAMGMTTPQTPQQPFQPYQQYSEPHEAAAVVPAEKAAVVPIEKDAPVPVELESPGWETTAYSNSTRSPMGPEHIVSPLTDQGNEWRAEKPRNEWV